MAANGPGERRSDSRGATRRDGYRPDIDGLRAIAVLAVVLFHARVPGFSGGFVGVDVFFVISGYLIARLILTEKAEGRFTFAGFYERRVRRIMPALLAMLAVSGVLALILLPADLRRFGSSLAAMSVFLSNIQFARWNDYFGFATGSAPLLHTWSLAIEEQFYLAFPVVLVLAGRGGPRLAALAIALIGALSFGYSAWAAAQATSLAFYSPASRAWEFMVGALLATGLIPSLSNRRLGDVLAGLGLTAIGVAIWRLTPASAFPGVNALAPCLGAALIIQGAGAPGSLVGRLLAVRPLVAVGLASYSLYLWHWPLIVFGSYYVLDEAWVTPARVALAAVSVPVAFASRRWIEQPFRGPRGRFSRRTLFVGVFLASLVLGLYGVTLRALGGLPQRFDPAVLRLARSDFRAAFPCADQPLDRRRTNRACIIGDPSRRPDFVLWGDSHAAMYREGLDALARRQGVAGYDMTALGCAPLIGFREPLWQGCQARNREILRLIAAERPRAVILAGKWGPSFGPFIRPDFRGLWTQQRRHDPRFTPREAREGLDGVVSALKALGVEVYFVEDIPFVLAATPDRLAKARVLGSTPPAGITTTEYDLQLSGAAPLAAALERRGAMHILRPGRMLCDARTCRVHTPDGALYRDAGHLNERGSRLVSPAFEAVLTRPDRPGS